MYEIWKHLPTRTYITMTEGTSLSDFIKIADKLQQEYRIRKKKRLYTPQYPRFTVRDSDGICVYSAWKVDGDKYKVVP